LENEAVLLSIQVLLKTLNIIEREELDILFKPNLYLYMKVKLILVLSLLLFQSILALSQTNNADFGSVIFNLKFSSFNESGFGGKIRIINTTSGIEYNGKSTSSFNSQITLRNLPAGNYKIVELIIKMGRGQIGYNDSSKFNLINIEAGKTSYLGTYRAKKTSQIFKLNYELFRDANFDKEKVEKQALKVNGTDSDIDFSQNLLKSDTTYFSIK
jgi:hypothetical protein